MYSIIWQYKVKQENQYRFEFEYGANGTWTKFFSNYEGYNGSSLYKSTEKTNLYLLIDTWSGQELYGAFQVDSINEYKQLSTKFESLYETEIKIGEFILLDL